MPGATVLARGRRLYLVTPGRPPEGYPAEAASAPAMDALSDTGAGLPPGLPDRLRSIPPGTPVTAAGAALRQRLSAELHRPIAPPDLDEWRAARAALPNDPPPQERAFVLALARRRLEAALRAPEEMLITLAREEERVERARAREEAASAAFLPLPDSALAEYAVRWEQLRRRLAEHHDRLLAGVERAAGEIAPNLSAVVGPRAAARLLAAGGGLAALGRMRAPRLQLLGSRRRPSAEHGPRFGVLYRGARMDDVPIDRRAAYARSLAALAAIAVRADATTRADLRGALVARRDRRVDELRRRRR